MAKHLSLFHHTRASSLKRTLCVTALLGIGFTLDVEQLYAHNSTSTTDNTHTTVQTNGRVVKGTVVDEKGEILPGANIQIEGTTTGTTSDMNGRFRVTLPEGKTKLRVSFMGYTTISVVAKDGMRIELQPDSKTIKEVVVTGMVATDKRLFTGASDRITADKVKLDGLADVSRGLEGRSAGVSVQNVSGTFGTAPKIRVRGATSIYGNSKPLWVVDGVIQEDIVEVGPDALSSGDAVTLISSAIAGLNANDIESFQILKDGSATSIYGAKAMAGVIVITTKKGRKGTAGFSYVGEFTSRLIPSYSEFNIMNSQNQMSVYRELHDKGWLNLAETFRDPDSGVFGKMYHLIHQYDPATGHYALSNTAAARRAYLRDAEYRNTDWFAELFSPAVMMNHSVSMSSGTDKSQTYASLSVMTDPGWMKGSEVNRYTANLNTTHNISKWVSANIIANVSYRQQQAPGTLGQDVDVVSGAVSRAFDINPYSYALNTSRTLDPSVSYTRNFSPFNIHKELENNYIDLNVLDIRFQSQLEWKPIRGMTLQALGAVRYSSTEQEHKITEFSNQSMAYRAMADATIVRRNSWLYRDPDAPNTLPFTILPAGGFYNTTTYRMLSYDFRATAQYNTAIKEDHIINTYAGIEFNAQNRMQNNFDGWGMQYNNGERPFWDYRAFKRIREGNDDYYSLINARTRTQAFFATATYSYKGRYTITGTGRYEGSNRLGKARSARWLPTYNIAGAWNVHEEGWFAKSRLSKWLSHFTLKTSYSLTADAGPAHVTNSRVIITSYSPWRPLTNVAESGLIIRDLENQDLTYEKKKEFNLGIDAGFWDNRISVAADWYTRNNYDLIGSVNTQGAGGMTQRMGNVASMKSHGFELSITTRNIESKRFKWSTNFVFGTNHNEITDLKTRATVMDYIRGSGFAREGYPVRSLFSIPFVGLDDSGFPMFRVQDQIISKDNYRNIIFQERDNVSYLKYEGATDPTFNGSLGNIFDVGNFRLNVFVTYSGGNVVRLNPVFRASYSDLDATPKEFNNRWIQSGDEKITTIPTIATRREMDSSPGLAQGYNAYNYSTARVAKGDFVRLKEVSLSYTLPSKWLGKGIIKNASIKLQGTNLMLLYSDSKLNGQDPEFLLAGGVSAPIPKQFTLTLNIGF